MRGKKKSKVLLVSIMIIIFIIAAITLYVSMMLSGVGKSGENIYIRIEEGSYLNTISTVLKENELIRSEFIFETYVKVTGVADDLKAGSYTLNDGMSVKELSEVLQTGGNSETMRVTIREGLDLNRIGDYFEEVGLFTKEEFLNEIKDNKDYYREQYAFLQSVPEDREYILEGYLFGDTYEVYNAATPRDIITLMLDRFDREFTDEYYARAEEMGMSVDEIVTMASVVEREIILNEELPIAASVFYNRLDQNMAFQSCATLQYIYEDYQFTFSESQKSVDDPYNTYKYTGLPAGPIANFRAESLNAALYPASTDYLYFCTKNDGTGATAFATTYAGHQDNINKYSGNWE